MRFSDVSGEYGIRDSIVALGMFIIRLFAIERFLKYALDRVLVRNVNSVIQTTEKLDESFSITVSNLIVCFPT